jgi:hypothetical protein
MDAKYWLKNDFEDMTRRILNRSKDRVCEGAEWWEKTLCTTQKGV